MGGAQPLAVTMNGGVALVVEVDPARIEKRLATKYLDESTADVEQAIETARAWRSRASPARSAWSATRRR